MITALIVSAVLAAAVLIPRAAESYLRRHIADKEF